MRLGNVSSLVDQVSKVEIYGPGAKVRHAFRIRLAELVSEVTGPGLAQATEALIALHSTETLSLAESLQGLPQAPPSKISSLQCPYKAMEERIGKLAFAGRGNLSLLTACLEAASRLQSLGLIRAEVRGAVAGCLLRWAEESPLQELRRQLPALAFLAGEEPAMLSALEQRLVQRAGRGFPVAGQFAGFFKLLLDLRKDGLRLLDGPGLPVDRWVLDAASVAHIPPLRLAALDAIREVLLHWPIQRLAEEFRGPVFTLCKEFPLDVKPQVCLAVTQRAVLSLEACSEIVAREGDCMRLQQDLILWSAFASSTASEGLLRPRAKAYKQILADAVTFGSMAFCAAAITPGCTEMMQGFKGRSDELAQRASDLLHALAEVKALLLDQVPPEPPQGQLAETEGMS